MKIKGFTLAEVLITLGIIGVIAALTLPTIRIAYQARYLKSQFSKSYSTIQNVITRMQADLESLNPRMYPQGTFYTTFAKYVNVIADCGIDSSDQNIKISNLCATLETTDYRTFTTNGMNENYIKGGGQLVLQDGTNVFFNNSSEYISFDLNGHSKAPNMAGYDLFTFKLVDGEFIPLGDPNLPYAPNSCSTEWLANISSLACAYKALTEPDYFEWVVKKFK